LFRWSISWYDSEPTDQMWQVLLERDGTESGIAYELEAAGIPKDRIVLAFRAPEMRPQTGYAVA
jgi:XisI protein